MFLGLLKYYRQSYLDLVLEAEFDRDYENKCRRFVDRFYDRIEIGLCKEWIGTDQTQLLTELQATNRQITIEKNKYLTVFESSSQPMLLLNRDLKVENLNHAAVEMLCGTSIPGSFYYCSQHDRIMEVDSGEAATFPWGRPTEEYLPELARDIAEFVQGSKAAQTIEKQLTLKGISRHFEVRLSRMLDISEKFSGFLMTLTDITERKLVEEALCESEERFRKYYELDLIGMAITSPQMGWVQVNDRLCEILGYPREEITHLTWGDLTHPDDIAADVANFNSVLTGDRDGYNMDKRFIRKDGRIVHANISAACLRRDDGSVDHFVALVQDISDRKRAETALKESESLLRNIIDSSPDYIYVKDLDLRTLLCNRVFAEAVGKEPADLVGRTDIENGWDPELVKGNPAKGIRGFEQDDRAALAGGLVHIAGEVGNVGSELRVFDTVKLPLREPDGKVFGMLGISRDVTAQRRAEEELRASEERYRLIADNTSDSIWAMDADLRFTYLSPSTERLFGYTLSEWDSMEWSAFVHPEYMDTVLGVFEGLRQEPGKGSAIVRVRHKNGPDIWVEFTASSVTGPHGELTGVVGVTRDVTTRKAIEDELRQSLQTAADLVGALPLGLFIYQYEPPDCLLLITGNPEAERLTGISEVTFRGRGFNEIWPQAREAGITDKYLEVVRTGRTYETEDLHYQDHRLSGAYRIRAFVLPGQRLAVAFEDITARKRTEEALQESEEKYRTIFENAPLGLFRSTPEGRFIEVNPALAEMFGYDSPKAILRKIYSIADQLYVRSEDRQPIVERQLQSQAVIRHLNHYRRRNGEEFIANLYLKTVRDAKGQPLYLEGIVEDITERRQAEEALRESEARFRTLAESSPIAIYETDAEGKCLYVNPKWCELTGLSPDEARGEGWSRGLHPDDRQEIFRKWNEHAEGILPWSLEYRFRTSEGRISWVFGTSESLRDAEGRITGYMGVNMDITERKRSEEELRQNRNMLDTILNTIPQSVFWKDRDSRYLGCNIPFAHAVGLESPDGIVGKTDFDLPWPREEADAYRADDRIVMDNNSPKSHIIEPLQQANGSRIWIDTTKIPLRDENGCVYGVLGVYEDITDRMRAERESAALDAVSHLFLRSLPLPTVYQDLAKCLYSTLGFPIVAVELFDLRAREMIFVGSTGMAGVPVGMRVPADQTLSGSVAENGQGLCEERAKQRPEYRFEKLRQFGVETFICVPFFVRGKVAGTLALADRVQRQDAPLWMSTLKAIATSLSQEIERKLAEEALRESEERFREIAETVNEVFWVGAADWSRVYYVSPAYERIWGRTVQSLYEQPLSWLDALHPDDQEAARLDIDARTHGGSTTPDFAPYRIMRPDGSIRWISARVFPVLNPDGQIARVVGIAEDITAHKQAEAEREKLQTQLAQAQKMESVGRLAGGVAHDFNNMLGVILGHTEMALEEVDPGQPLFADLQEVRKAADRSAELTRQLLAFARKQTIAPRVIDLNETVEGMLKMLRRLIGEDIDLAWLPGGNLAPIRVDPSQIDQILANLCVNARDAIAGTGKITIETDNVSFDEMYCADHTDSVPGEYVLLAVSDDGCGMDAATLAHLFEPFFTTKGVGKGTGLGLATLYGAVRQNNGFVNVYSEPGRGTTFKIFFPRHAAKTAETDERRPQATTRGSETILLVEDESAILSMTIRMLEREGYTVVGAGTPGEAIRLAKEHAGTIHLLMTDVVMPEMNGRDLAKNILSLYPGVKCLFMSGYTANVIAHHGVLDEGVNFIQKPFSRRDLAAKLRQALRGDDDL
jgi:PAS domain S-box-containing protein